MSDPAWTNFAELHRATGETTSSLTWLANAGRFYRHYRQKWVAKRSGRRLLEAPLPRLKHVQRVVLRHVLEDAPLHPAAMAFRRGRGVIDHAQRHAGRRWVVCLDLADFFPSVGSRRIAGIFRTLGFSPELARVLGDLTTTTASLDTDATRAERLLYERRHLPQGAPTSPALANLVARNLDQRLDAFARRLGGTYSRYADDLVVSCDRLPPWLVPTIAAIAIDEGFQVRFRKTKVTSQAGRQLVTGLVVNERPGLPRIERKRLEAILFNCVRHGPASQDRHGLGPRFEAHLRGRVAHARHVDPARTPKLTSLLHQIDWTR